MISDSHMETHKKNYKVQVAEHYKDILTIKKPYL